MICREVIKELEKLSPIKYASDWDNVGLMVGDEEKEVKKILVVLDVTNKVIEKAINLGVDIIISHHPLIFKPLKNVNNKTVEGRKVLSLIKNDIVVYSLHTNFDVEGSMAKIAGEIMELNNTKPLEELYIEDNKAKGFGVVGELSNPIDLYQFAKKVKEKFKIADIKVYGNKDKKIEKVAILPGSGKDFMQYCKLHNVDAYITGDVSHHQGIDGIEMGIAIIDAGHYGIEKIFINYIKQFLESKFDNLEIVADNIGESFFTLPNY